MYSKVTLLGYAGDRPERIGSGGVRFRVATHTYKPRATTWHTVVTFSEVLAERAMETIERGSQVFVEGHLSYSTYEGKNYTSIIMNVLRVFGDRDEEDEEPIAPPPISSREDTSRPQHGQRVPFEDDVPF